jgi:tRNA U34 5-methylaminomethyl-2-thiouridine-forming methyltransferase MnmC
MSTENQCEQVRWRDDSVPVSSLFDDPYYSLQGGLAETRHVFLAGNHLPHRFQDGFTIAELGFGTGLNLLATAQAFAASGLPGRISFTSFEAYPMPPADMARSLAAFPDLAPLAAPLLSAWGQGARRFDLEQVAVEVIVGDARAALPEWQGRADAWYLDGFSPARNPELWGDALMAEVARHTAAGGTFASYTAAGFVRRSLQAAGFAVTRQPGYGRKRHMSRGILNQGQLDGQ